MGSWRRSAVSRDQFLPAAGRILLRLASGGEAAVYGVGLLSRHARREASFRIAGCRRVYIDGSFVSAKEVPGDFDGCWEATGMDLTSLDPVLLTFTQRRVAQKAR